MDGKRQFCKVRLFFILGMVPRIKKGKLWTKVPVLRRGGWKGKHFSELGHSFKGNLSSE